MKNLGLVLALAVSVGACLATSTPGSSDDPVDPNAPDDEGAVIDEAKAAPAPTYSVGGTLSGYLGPVLVARNNGDTLVIHGNGTFTFGDKLPTGAAYQVTILAQPTSGTPCTVTNGSGVIANANVTSVRITCAPVHKIGGTVTGLVGTGLVLRDNGGDDLAIAANGAFAFATSLATGASYAVTTYANPTSPAQRCTVTNDHGTVGTTDVTNVTVTCQAPSYTVGGTVAGARGTVVLQDNGGDDLATGNGAFTFATPVASGQPYSVSVRAAAPGDHCVVANASGVVTATVTSVAVTCAPETEFYVDAAVGNDANPGTAAAPWRTLTKAIATAPTTLANIHVAPGTYTDGEQFPVAPRANQHLIGDVANHGEGPVPTRIAGSGVFNCSGGDLANSGIAVAVGLEASAMNSSIAGFSISGGSETVWICNTTTTFASNTVSGSTDISIIVGAGANVTLTDDRITSGAYGLLVCDATTRLTARNTVFGPSSRSVVLGFLSPFTGANVDFGTATSPGGNVFPGSDTGVGMYFQNTTGSVVHAAGNTWKANVQGADAAGHYATQQVTASVSAVAGANFATAFTTGGGLQL